MKEKTKLLISNQEPKNSNQITIKPEHILSGSIKAHDFPNSEIFIDKIDSKVQLQSIIYHLDQIGRDFHVDYRNFTESLSPLHRNGFVLFATKQRWKNATTIKRLFDLIATTSAIILLSPILIITAILIKLSSSGPILFKQVRIGLNGKQFVMFKFRSMINNAEAHKKELIHMNKRDGPTFKIDNDPRVTPIGKFIRKHSIDELPQLFNILTGDMSIVGPRPPLPEEFKSYSTWQTRRLSVPPGLTCYWQILRNKNIDFSQWVKLDLKYIDNWSFWTDISIIYKTIPEVIFGRRSN
jgi:lipopolysaccharide/colanic/teichoic acid biosynthesis glycosyltransferase